MLYGRLAFNQAYFLYVAMLSTGPWAGRGHYWAAGVLLLPLIAQVVLRLASRERPGEPLVRRLFWMLLLVPVLNQTNNIMNISSPLPDLPMFCISIVLAVDLLDLIMLPGILTRGLAWRVLRIVLLGLVSVTVKFSFLIFGAGSVALAVGVGTWRMAAQRRMQIRKTDFATPLRLIGAAAALAVLILPPWMGRDICLSGYIAYPADLFTD